MVNEKRDLQNDIEYIYRYIHIIPGVQKEIENMHPDWKAELLFYPVLGLIGSYIVENYESIPEKCMRNLFSLIEDGVNSEDKYISTAIATELLEAMVNKGDGNLERWRIIWKNFGKESKEYIKAWNKFCGVDMHLD